MVSEKAPQVLVDTEQRDWGPPSRLSWNSGGLEETEEVLDFKKYRVHWGGSKGVRLFRFFLKS